MKIFKFTESQNSDQTLYNLFEAASQEFEEVCDFFLEIEDSKTFTFGHNYCAYYPSTKEYFLSEFLCNSFHAIKQSFSDSAIDDILSGEANISFLIGIACVPEELNSTTVQSFQGEEVEGNNKEYVVYNQTHLSNFVKLAQTLKQADLRLDKNRYDIKYQYDNYGATVLIGRRKLD